MCIDLNDVKIDSLLKKDSSVCAIQFPFHKERITMGLFHSDLSYDQKQILRNSVGFKVDEIRPNVSNYPIYTFHERATYQKHAIPNSIAFFAIRGEYIASAKFIHGKKTHYYC
jgi:hypothetical protein